MGDESLILNEAFVLWTDVVRLMHYEYLVFFGGGP